MADDRIIYEPEGPDYPDNVIELADVRLARGWVRPSKVCAHLSLVYSSRDRRIECKHCDSQVDGFDAFMMLVRRYEDIERQAQSRFQKAKEALGAVIVRRAAKAIDRAWGRKMAPCCPHCKRGLLPADFENGASSSIGIEFETARRKAQSHD